MSEPQPLFVNDPQCVMLDGDRAVTMLRPGERRGDRTWWMQGRDYHQKVFVPGCPDGRRACATACGRYTIRADAPLPVIVQRCPHLSGTPRKMAETCYAVPCSYTREAAVGIARLRASGDDGDE